ncbi:aspartyl/asparaginyl beta-hydroxylase domain-containing protein [Novosphingobium olei]|uniref:aspartyl/asparaginyl beta-hydroxylase domain-containing protein n=1 Tax=Novosphingobium olei TaxID=2728851 RepID=UPI0030D5EBC2
MKSQMMRRRRREAFGRVVTSKLGELMGTSPLDEVDIALANRDIAKARMLLESIVSKQNPSIDAWRRLAAMRRAEGDLKGALDALSEALSLHPLDFFSLLARASILEQAGHASAGEAYGRALTQRPKGDFPPHLQKAVDQAEKFYRIHQGNVQSNLQSSANLFGSSAAEKQRISRFASNIARITRHWHSEPTHFHYPALCEEEFHPRDRFPWLPALEALTETIKAEFETVLKAESACLVPYLNYPKDQPLAQWQRLNQNRDWTAIHLLERGRQIERNARHCPHTMTALSHIPQPAIAGCGANAMFSLLAPHTHIPPHVGVANFRLVCHLPLVIPSDCWFRVGATSRTWIPNEAFVFDDTIQHEAANESDELRVVLIFDIWHPDLTPNEQKMIAALVSQSPEIAGSL